MLLKKRILRYTPPLLHKLLRDAYFSVKLLPCYAYDYKRFLSYSGLNKSRDSKTERAARITLFYHQVEKGLSLASPRSGFGMTVIPGLLDDVDTYLADYGISEPATNAIAALFNYLDYHERIGHPVDFVRGRLFSILDKHHIPLDVARLWHGGVLPFTRAELSMARNAGFKSFFNSRYSVRQFAGGVIPEGDIRSAVELAQKTPSVCNRQSWRVHAFNDAGQMERLLAIQSGSNGFGHQASYVLIVTCELRKFLGIDERYQPWIDGGMFAMSLCLAFHDLGYGTCCLNWSKEPHDDKAMRAAAPISPSEQIIMLMAVGTLADEFNVARSYRPNVDHCLSIHSACIEPITGK
ncbi:MAG: nitroreductase family protein [Methylobacter sp.]|uniref:nitroreductase family protein n=1 Tax=Methylobacter sp. TaxID=2051955 RepID=UPI0025EE8853|nr:nitroreductase family protein [Methylobacter sp.]MCK9620225.1 nitroreductase family protein [Methylobacter sp.]